MLSLSSRSRSLISSRSFLQTSQRTLARSFSSASNEELQSPPSRFFNRRDIDFLLYDCPTIIPTSKILNLPKYKDNEVTPDREMVDQILNTAESFITKWAHVDPKLDREEPRFDPSESNTSSSPVIMCPLVKPVLDAYVEAGFTTLQSDYNLPYLFQTAAHSVTGSAFTSGVLGTWILTFSAANLLNEHGSEKLKGVYYDKMCNGEWTGTMALSETQAGSSLADITAKAEKAEDGTYKISGNKMWTSGQDHSMYENIIHMVLAKTEGGKISLFLVPKYLVNDDGSLGEKNDIQTNGLNHKMGSRGLSNTYWSLGDEGGATGYLLGTEGRGLGCMLFMMNEMRVFVGLGATMCGVRGYLESLKYAIERKQGRLIADSVPGGPKGKKNANAPQVPIIQHSDVKRMLLQQKVYAEGSQALVYLAAGLIDTSSDTANSKNDAALLEFIIPVVKSWPSEFSLEANKWAIQILGGYGYTQDFPLEQIYRDNRLNMIHEGAHGVQAVTLLGRNVALEGGLGAGILCEKMLNCSYIAQTYTNDAASHDHKALLLECGTALKLATFRFKSVSESLVGVMGKGEINRALSNSYEFMNMTGHTIVGWLWLEMAINAVNKLDEMEAAGGGDSEEEKNFLQGKIAACQYFFRFELRKTEAQAKLLTDMDDTVFNANASYF